MPASDLAWIEKLIWNNLPQQYKWQAISQYIKKLLQINGKGTMPEKEYERAIF